MHFFPAGCFWPVVSCHPRQTTSNWQLSRSIVTVCPSCECAVTHLSALPGTSWPVPLEGTLYHPYLMRHNATTYLSKMGIPSKGHNTATAKAKKTINAMLMGMPCLRNSPAVNCLDS